jgi:hypothetical protein
MPIVGSFAGASARAYGLGAGVLVGDFESIQTITVGTPVASITFTSIPATYTHLQIRFSCQTSNTTNSGLGNDRLNGYFNADETATNYYSHYLIGNGSASSAAEQVAKWAGNGTRNSMLGWGTGVIDILDYANTNKFKTTRAIEGFNNNDTNASYNSARLTSGLWRNTAAITSIKIAPEAAVNFKQYSSFALYGVKA